jgi:hypothetical protein
MPSVMRRLAKLLVVRWLVEKSADSTLKDPYTAVDAITYAGEVKVLPC